MPAIPTLADPKELAESVSPSSAGFSVYDARSTRPTWLTNPQDPTYVQKILPLLLGETNLTVQPTARMNRTPPAADPVWPWLFASSISNFKGAGQYVNMLSNAALEAPTLPRFAFYQSRNPGGNGVREGGYFVDVEFTPRPYAVIGDNFIQPTVSSYFDDAGAGHAFAYAPEWLRYTDYDFIPQDNFITARQGQMVFRDGSAANGTPFDGMPRMYLPDQVLRFRWFQVPYRYITSPNSYIERFRGRINQFPWYNWPRGSLLYKNYDAKRYTPPVPKRVQFGPGFIYSTEKLVDIEFYFLLTRRTAASTPTIPANSSWVTAGHNLLPWFYDRGYHYATVQGAKIAGIPQPGTWIPSYLSCPFELLFTDPDFKQT
jgi:hypothetical protein